MQFLVDKATLCDATLNLIQRHTLGIFHMLCVKIGKKIPARSKTPDPPGPILRDLLRQFGIYDDDFSLKGSSSDYIGEGCAH